MCGNPAGNQAPNRSDQAREVKEWGNACKDSERLAVRTDKNKWAFGSY